jgi:sterol desaturase/sphingolipid hydroxylase (fatty acid hydroxylase superfamily)
MSFFTQIVLEHILIHWVICLGCFLFDKYSLNKYKLRTANIADTPRNIIATVLFNQIFIAMPIFWLLNDFSEQQLFSLENLYKIPLTIIYEDILFYYAHRILHIPYLYERIHKIHHRWTTPIAVSAFYTHPFEHAFANILPVVLSARLAGLGQGAMRLWQAIALTNTLITAHGGYRIPRYSNMHDKHHTDFNCNYGAIGLLDSLYGTLR